MEKINLGFKIHAVTKWFVTALEFFCYDATLIELELKKPQITAAN
jgi:hypothetical protein